LRQLTKNARTTVTVRGLADRAAGPVITVLLSVAAMAHALRVWQWRPGDPVDLTGDSPSGLSQFKNMLDHGWYGSNPDLGAPFSQDASWFPHADQLHLVLMGKVIGLFSDNPFTVSAVYYFLGFPLAALSMYWLARQLHLGRPGSVLAGVLFSVIPGHQTMYPHLMLAAYWVVPLGMWLVLRAALGEPLFRVKVAWQDPVQRRPALRLNLTTAFCVLCIAIGGIYYSAFTLLLLAVSLAVRLVATRDPGSVARAALLPAAIGALSLAALLSITAGQDKSTMVTAPAQREIWESERFAGKFMDLVLPWIHHRVDALQQLTVTYNNSATATFEKPALGVIALAGVVALTVIMLSALVPARVKPVEPAMGMIGVLTVVSIFFFSVGGLGSAVAQFLTPQIRTWSRLFIVIGLFGLLAVGHWVTVVSQRNRILGVLTAVAIMIIGVLDQTNPAMAPNYQALRSEVADLTTFSRDIEARVEAGCSVFQLPIATYPEHDYAHFRPYLTSTSLRWSFGAFRGTSLADWQLALPQKSTSALVDDLAAAGFCAIEVDRAAAPDGATAREADLRRLLGAPIAATRDGRLFAWDLAPARARLTSQIGAEQVSAKGELVLHPLIVYTDGDGYDDDQNSQTAYEWTGASPGIDVHNFGRTTINGVRLTFSLASPDSAPRKFTVQLPDGRNLDVDVKVGIVTEVHVLVNAAPGRNTVVITSTGPTPDAGSQSVIGRLANVQAQAPEGSTQIAVVQRLAG
jgi:hypothetical protein